MVDEAKMKFITETVMQKRILIVTNDSTVFLNPNRIDTAFNMFGGRATEVKKLVARLDTAVDGNGKKLCDVSFGVITTQYGFVPGNYQIVSYNNVMSDRAGYEDCENRKQFVEQVSYLCKPFDKVVLCVPKDMFLMFLEADLIDDGKLIAVTNPCFKEECEKRGWTYLERNGARVGNDNADRIEEYVRELCSNNKVA